MNAYELIEKMPELASSGHDWDNIFNPERREDIIADRIYDWGCWNCGLEEAKEKRTPETVEDYDRQYESHTKDSNYYYHRRNLCDECLDEAKINGVCDCCLKPLKKGKECPSDWGLY